MASKKNNKHPPAWLPADLNEVIAELKAKDAEEQKRRKSKPPRLLDKRADLEKGRLYLGPYFLSSGTQLKIAEALAAHPAMESVWKSLLRRSDSFKPMRILFFGGMAPASNLFGACSEIENNWINLPKRTRTETRKLYEAISALSLQLTELLLQVEPRELLDIRNFIEPERLKAFIDALEHDDHKIWYGFEGYLDHLLSELIEPVPGLLLKLNKRALEHAEYPLAVSQPNSPNAKINYFIQGLSDYFARSYGQPLHAHVAAVVSAVLSVEIDEDRVRALLRARKTARKRHTRKKAEELRKESTG